MAKDMYSLYDTFTNHNQVKHYESFKTLARVFDQQCERVGGSDGEKLEVVIREQPKGDEIISTPQTPMHVMSEKGNKRFAVKKDL